MHVPRIASKTRPPGNKFVQICPIIEEVEELRHCLPPDERYMTHTLNLVATVDGAQNEQTNPNYGKVAKSVFSKCSKLWSKLGQSDIKGDALKAHCAIYLPRPVITRCNSLSKAMDAIDYQSKIGDDPHGLYYKLALPRLQ